jgi:hypothetical protein
MIRMQLANQEVKRRIRIGEIDEIVENLEDPKVGKQPKANHPDELVGWKRRRRDDGVSETLIVRLHPTDSKELLEAHQNFRNAMNTQRDALLELLTKMERARNRR